MDTKEGARRYRLKNWSALIAEWQTSDLNVREFFKERNIKVHSSRSIDIHILSIH